MDWDPDALKTDYLAPNEMVLHYLASYCCSPSFKMALTAGLRYFPDELGLLCLKDDEGESVIEIAY